MLNNTTAWRSILEVLGGSSIEREINTTQKVKCVHIFEKVVSSEVDRHALLVLNPGAKLLDRSLCKQWFYHANL